MGLFSSITSIVSSISNSSETKDESLESMRKKHGFPDFSADMERMRNYDPEKEMQKENLSKIPPATLTPLPGKKK